jgi:hypothetical protein
VNPVGTIHAGPEPTTEENRQAVQHDLTLEFETLTTQKAGPRFPARTGFCVFFNEKLPQYFQDSLRTAEGVDL